MLLMAITRSCCIAFAAAALCLAADSSFTGVIGDDMCKGDHKSMGGTDAAKCTQECVSGMHAKYALWVGKDAYVLSDQKKPAQYAGKKVTVTGSLNGNELQVKTIKPAN